MYTYLCIFLNASSRLPTQPWWFRCLGEARWTDSSAAEAGSWYQLVIPWSRHVLLGARKCTGDLGLIHWIKGFLQTSNKILETGFSGFVHAGWLSIQAAWKFNVIYPYVDQLINHYLPLFNITAWPLWATMKFMVIFCMIWPYLTILGEQIISTTDPRGIALNFEVQIRRELRARRQTRRWSVLVKDLRGIIGDINDGTIAYEQTDMNLNHKQHCLNRVIKVVSGWVIMVHDGECCSMWANDGQQRLLMANE